MPGTRIAATPDELIASGPLCSPTISEYEIERRGLAARRLAPWAVAPRARCPLWSRCPQNERAPAVFLHNDIFEREDFSDRWFPPRVASATRARTSRYATHRCVDCQRADGVAAAGQRRDCNACSRVVGCVRGSCAPVDVADDPHVTAGTDLHAGAARRSESIRIDGVDHRWRRRIVARRRAAAADKHEDARR